MTTARDKLLQQFRELVIERLEKIARNLMKLEGGADVEAGKAALRELHGLKGEARMMGFAEVNTIVHEMEDVVRAAQDAGYALQPGSTDALLVASDAVTVLSGAGQGNAVEVPRLLEWLKQRTEAEKALRGPAGAPAAGAGTAPGTGSFPAPPPSAGSGSGVFPAPEPGSGTGSFTRPTFPSGSVPPAAPEPGSGTGSFTRPNFLPGSVPPSAPEQGSGTGSFTRPNFLPGSVPPSAPEQGSGTGSFARPTFPPAGASPSAPGATATGLDAPRPPSAKPSSPGTRIEPKVEGGIRISQQSLETLTSSVTGLLQRNRRREHAAQRQLRLSRELAQLHRLAEDLGAAGSNLAGRLAKTKEVVAELHRDGKLLANEEMRDLTLLSEEVQAMRMLPLAVLFEPYPRMVRELAKELGKEVELTVEGEDTRVDRSVLEALREPLLHLVRNALDHGLEDREGRLEASKAPRGHLTLSARREGERLLLRVEDDGRGLDPVALREVAVRRGIVDAEAVSALTDDAARDLVFLAGFSSKDSATELSGRGVGLDVVRVRMVALGGEATVESETGKGSAFEVRVPISLTVAPLLFIEVGQERLCLTAANVDRAVKVAAGAARELAGRPGLSVGDELVPFASISSILGAAPERVPSEGELVLVVKGRGQSAAIAVDRVLEERVQAVFPLKGMLANFTHLSGATPLADGSLAMVLSAAHLVSAAQGQRARLSGARAATAEVKRRRIMVVDDSPLTRELLSSLLEAVGFEIVNAGDGVEALERLSRESVDLVVTDLEMPRVDGLELTRRLKTHPTLSALPVVIVTTRGSEADKKKGMEAGADGYVTKGDLVRQDLVDVVSRLLA